MISSEGVSVQLPVNQVFQAIETHLSPQINVHIQQTDATVNKTMWDNATCEQGNPTNWIVDWVEFNIP